MAEVKGKVTYNGAPLAKQGGQIVFVAANGKQTVGSIGDDGTYLVSKVLVGPNRVAVSYPNSQAKTAAAKRFPEKGKPPPPPPPVTAPSPFLTPLKYASVDSSELKLDVASGAVFNVDLIGPPIK
ncbi:MAG: hypothetical protein U0744_17410 [Gemmataceae bacterium]